MMELWVNINGNALWSTRLTWRNWYKLVWRYRILLGTSADGMSFDEPCTRDLHGGTH